MKVYLDSCILIYRLEGADAASQAVAESIRGVAGATFCISDLVRLECLVDPIRRGDAERRRAYEAQFRSLSQVPLTSTVYDLAAEIRALHSIRTPDAIHAAAAIVHGCGELWTNDKRIAVLEDRIVVRLVPGVGP